MIVKKMKTNHNCIDYDTPVEDKKEQVEDEACESCTI